MEMDAHIGVPELTAILAGAAFFWFVWARIFERAGYSRWWAFTIFIPLWNLYMAGKLILTAGYSIFWLLVLFMPPINFLMLMMFAFGEWPSDRRLYRTVKL